MNYQTWLSSLRPGDAIEVLFPWESGAKPLLGRVVATQAPGTEKWRWRITCFRERQWVFDIPEGGATTRVVMSPRESGVDGAPRKDFRLYSFPQCRVMGEVACCSND